MKLRKLGLMVLMAAFVGSPLVMPGCKKDEGKSPGEKVGDAIDKGVEKTGEAIEDAGDAIEDAGDKIKD